MCAKKHNQLGIICTTPNSYTSDDITFLSFLSNLDIIFQNN